MLTPGFDRATLLAMMCLPVLSHASLAAPAGGKSLAVRIAGIRAEAKRIEAAAKASPSGELRRMNKELPHWQFSGVFDSSTPVFLSAQFSEGQVVREEKYYLSTGKLILVKTEQWWDVDNARQEGEPATRQEFYIELDSTIRHVTEVDSVPPKRQISDTIRPASALAARSRAIVSILLESTADTAAAASLEKFPD